MDYTETKQGKYVIRTYEDGVKEWYLNGKPHREDGPAIEHKNGSKEWYINGKRHREDGPAIEDSDGTKEWWLNGELVYNKYMDELNKFQNLSDEFKRSVIKYKLKK